MLVAIVVHVEVLVGLGMALLFDSGIPAAASCSRSCHGTLRGERGLGRGDVALHARFAARPCEPIAVLYRLPGRSNGRSIRGTALGIVAVMSIWLTCRSASSFSTRHGFGLAARIYEAASIDGASEWQSFRRITSAAAETCDARRGDLPLYLLVPSVLRGLASDQGGPARSTEVVALYLYQEAFRYTLRRWRRDGLAHGARLLRARAFYLRGSTGRCSATWLSVARDARTDLGTSATRRHGFDPCCRLADRADRPLAQA